MKAKHTLRFLAIAAVLCALMLLAVCAQQPDAKLLRFDGLGNVKFEIASAAGPVGVPDNSGNLLVTITKEMVDSRKGTNSRLSEPMFRVDEAERFDIEEYPFVQIKFRTDFPTNLNFYPNIADTASWANINYPHNRGWVYFNFNYAKKGTPLITEDIRIQVKANNASSVDSVTGDTYIEIEYIGYFKSAEDRDAYEQSQRDSYVVAADNTVNTPFALWTNYFTDSEGKANNQSVGDNGVFTSNEIADSWKRIFVRYKGSKFNLSDYNYLKLKAESNLTGSGVTTVSLAPYVNAATAGIGIYGTPYKLSPGVAKTLTYHIINGSYLNPITNETTQFASFVSGTPSPFPDEQHPMPLPATGNEYEGLWFNLNSYGTTALTGTLKFYYIGLFKSEAAMLAYDNPEDTAKVQSAVGALIDSLDAYTYYNLPDKDASAQEIADFLQKTLESEVAGTGASLSVEAQEDYAPGDPVCKVVAVLQGDYACDRLGFDVKVEKLDFILNTKGAQIRTDAGDKQALRFGAEIDKATVENADFYISCGMVVIPADVFDGEADELTLETGNVADVVCEVWFDRSDELLNTYTAVVTNIPDDCLDRKIIARPYLKFTLDGQENVYYGTPITRSVNDVKALSGWSADN